MTGGKFSGVDWSWNEADSPDALGLIGGKWFDGGSWNEADSLDTVGLTGSKFSDGGNLEME